MVPLPKAISGITLRHEGGYGWSHEIPKYLI